MWVGSVKRELMENYTGGELCESMPMGIKKWFNTLPTF